MEKEKLIRVLHIGNGEWYHGGENPLQHEWVTIGNQAKCRVCHKHIELSVKLAGKHQYPNYERIRRRRIL